MGVAARGERTLRERAAEPAIDQLIVAISGGWGGGGAMRWLTLDAKHLHPRSLEAMLSAHNSAPPPSLARYGVGLEEIVVGPPRAGKHHLLLAFYEYDRGATVQPPQPPPPISRHRGPQPCLDFLRTSPMSNGRAAGRSDRRLLIDYPDPTYMLLVLSAGPPPGDVYVAAGTRERLHEVHAGILDGAMPRGVAARLMTHISERAITLRMMQDCGATSLRCVAVPVV